MRIKSISALPIFPAILFAIVLMWSAPGLTHCDTMDSPVIKAAQKALETGNVNLVPVWVQEKDEAEAKTAFDKALDVGKLGPKAKELADMYFFETLVRIHRAGEGAPYSGLKPNQADILFHPSSLRLQLGFLSASPLDAMDASSSFQDLTNALPPSSWSCAAKGSVSIPALANLANTSSQ
jgi:hypothetical protein